MIYNFTSKEDVRLLKVGEKAKALIEIHKSGITLPEGFVMSVDFFMDWIYKLEESEEWRKFKFEPNKKNCILIENHARRLKLSNEKLEMINLELEKIPLNTNYAIRSSLYEGNDARAFIDHYGAVLSVKREDVEKTINEVFSSMIVNWLESQIIYYSKFKKIESSSPKIAIIIQKQIESDVSGKALSINQINNSFDEIMIKAQFGLGKENDFTKSYYDTYVINKFTNEITSKGLADNKVNLKRRQVKNQEEKEKNNFHIKTLTDGHIIMISRLVDKCENYYKSPVEIEWTFEDDRLYLLQVKETKDYNPLIDQMITKASRKKHLYFDLSIFSPRFKDNFTIIDQEIWNKIITEISRAYSINLKDKVIFNAYGREYINISNLTKALGFKKVKKILVGFDISLNNILELEGIEKKFFPRRKSEDIIVSFINYILKLSPKVVLSILSPYKSNEKYKELSLNTRRYIKEYMKKNDYIDDVIDNVIVEFSLLLKEAMSLFYTLDSYKYKKEEIKDFEDVWDFMLAELKNEIWKIGESFFRDGRLNEVKDIFDLSINQLSKAQKNRHIDLRLLIEENLAIGESLKHIKEWPEIVDSRGKIYRYI